MIPSFARIEIRLADKASLSTAADELEATAQRLRKLSGSKATGASEALVLAHSAIRETSKKLRGIEKC